MRTPSLATSLTLVLVGALVAGCSGTSADLGTDPTGGPTIGGPTIGGEQPTSDVVTVAAVPADSVPVALATTQVAACAPVPVDSASAVIGKKGGKVKLGKNELKIGKDALRNDVRITMVLLGDSASAVRLEPHGLVFGEKGKVTLKLDYDRCDSARESHKAKRVVYLDDNGGIAEAPETADDHGSHASEGTIGHFSKYAIAF